MKNWQGNGERNLTEREAKEKSEERCAGTTETPRECIVENGWRKGETGKYGIHTEVQM